MTANSVIQIENVSFSYTGAPVLIDINLSVYKDEFLGIVGPNAGGKSTLLKLILGLLQHDTGTIRVLGKTPVQGRSGLGYVPQYATFSREFPINVQDTVLLGRLGKNWYGRYSRHDREVACEVMAAFEIMNLRYRPVGSLSWRTTTACPDSPCTGL